MADTVSTNTLFNGARKLVVQLNCVSDGTGESAVVKVDKSTLTGLNRSEPSKLVVESIDWMVDGMTVELFFDRTSDVKIATLVGTGYTDYKCPAGGLQDTGTGGTGDIILTSTGATSGDSYKILLTLRKKD